MLQAEGFGTIFQVAISGDTIHFVGFSSFVDDKDQIKIARSAEEKREEVVVKMQGGINCWEGGIRVTARVIVPTKSHWYLLDLSGTNKGNGGWLQKQTITSTFSPSETAMVFDRCWNN
jgi:hypothetical protein